MIGNKLKKIKYISYALCNQRQELEKMGDSPGAEYIKKAFLHVKKGKFQKNNKQKLAALEAYIEELNSNQTEISYEFFGLNEKRKVYEIAQNAGSPKKWCSFFYFLTKFSGAKNILEIGTNLGISGQYFLSALPSGESYFTSLEGLPDLCKLASERFGKLENDSDFEVIQGMYDATLPKIAATEQKFDIVFFDGNHHYQPTIDYFNLLKGNYSRDAILVFDDINWSSGMKKAWKYLQNESGVYCSIEFYKLGILLYNPEKKALPKRDVKLFLTL